MKLKILKLALLMVLIVGVTITLVYEMSFDYSTHSKTFLWIGGIILGYGARGLSSEIDQIRRSRRKTKKAA